LTAPSARDPADRAAVKSVLLNNIVGQQISLEAARQKLDQIDQLTDHRRSVPLGMPTFSDSAGRTMTGRITLS